MAETTQDREAVERAAQSMCHPRHGDAWPALGCDECLRRSDAALSAAGWDEMRAEVERLRREVYEAEEDWAARCHATEAERDAALARAVSAERERAGLQADRRAVIAALGPHLRITDDLAGAVTRLALLAGSGEQSGANSQPAPSSAKAGRNRIAPVVPDSAGVREPFVGYLAEHVREAEGRLHNKYQVRRLADPSGKHSECRYFVLDPQHDEHAATALRAYAEAVRSDLPDLAADLDAWVGIAVVRPTVTAEHVHDATCVLDCPVKQAARDDRPAPPTTTHPSGQEPTTRGAGA